VSTNTRAWFKRHSAMNWLSREEIHPQRGYGFSLSSIRLSGKKPLTPDMVLKKIIRPPLIRAGVKDKVIGWHSLATNLRSLGVDVKVAQELLRHANSRVTMDIYTQAVSADKRIASQRQDEMLLA